MWISSFLPKLNEMRYTGLPFTPLKNMLFKGAFHNASDKHIKGINLLQIKVCFGTTYFLLVYTTFYVTSYQILSNTQKKNCLTKRKTKLKRNVF